MLIRVMYNEGGFDMVKPDLLDTLLEKKALTSFRRSDGWAVIGRDPVRHARKADYQGPERRRYGVSA